MYIYQGPHRDWKKGRAFSSQGKVREFLSDWKNQGILPKMLGKYAKINFMHALLHIRLCML